MRSKQMDHHEKLTTNVSNSENVCIVYENSIIFASLLPDRLMAGQQILILLV